MDTGQRQAGASRLPSFKRATAPLAFLLDRNPANFTHDRHYETNGWFFVENSLVNLMKNRYVITMPYLGIPVRDGWRAGGHTAGGCTVWGAGGAAGAE